VCEIWFISQQLKSSQKHNFDIISNKLNTSSTGTEIVEISQKENGGNNNDTSTTTTAAAAATTTTTTTTRFTSVHLLKSLTIIKPVTGKHCRKEVHKTKDVNRH
jgi:hypothetical protein